ncbi:hypothetical protein [Aquimarina spongiae]|uniref:Uncharacterized protein n=1 Tax=Aquimarina spongiae TaxID=570521 RepID=A0A1M6IS76_9FLAO|nr:hypothetical protein [Aquimarina spongiae]SHJ37330.1 hypothetical protein SAMN04488508_10841 [Aquimarina spongiae]
MTSGQRKAHKLIWMFLVIAIPVFVIFALKSIKEPFITDSDLSSREEITGKLILDDAQFQIQLLDKSNIQIILKRPLKSASSSVYGISSNNESEIFLGVLDKKGIYQFQINPNCKSIKIQDDIKHINLFNIEL